MNKSGRKWIALVIAVIMVLAMMPLSAGAAGSTAARAPADPGPAEPRLQTEAWRNGICIELDRAAETIRTFDVYRSTEAGVRGVKINEEPATGRQYMDEAAVAGVQYFYTVVVTGRRELSEGEEASDVRDLDVLGPVKAEVIEAEDPQEAPDTEAVTPVTRARRSAAAPRPFRAATAAALVSARTDVTSGTVINVNTTWTKANSPYYLQGDVVVAAGRTLTIQPGVEVYLSDFDDGGVYGADYGTSANPTSRCDLVVHGRLVAQGSALMPILFSSVKASLIATPGTVPTNGDWGSLFFDSMSASQMTYCDVQYGEGIWAKGTSRPYIDRCDIVNNNTGWVEKPWASVHFDDPMTDATTPRPRVTNTHIGSANRALEVSWMDPTVDKTIDPYIAANTIQGDWGIYLHVEQSDPASSTKSTVKGSIVGNSITVSTQDDRGVVLRAQGQSTGDAAVRTILSGNTIRSHNGYCIRAEAHAVGRGNADCVPMLYGGYHSTDNDDALYCFARSDEDTMANPGHAYASPVVSGGTYISAEDDCFEFEAYADGTGQARADSVLRSVRMENADDNGVEADATSEYGNASASPVMEDCSFKGLDADNAVDANAYSNTTGTAVCSPIWRRGSITNGGGNDGIETYARSNEGRAVSNPAVYSTSSIFCEDHLIEADAYGDWTNPTSSGGADCSPIVKDVRAYFRDDEGIDARAQSGGLGDTVCSPQVWRSWLRSSDAKAIDFYAYSYMGNATAKPFVTDSYFETEYGGVRGSAYIETLGGGTVKAEASPRIQRTEIRCDDDDRVEARAYNHGMGDAVARPTVTDSTLWSGDDDYDQAVVARASVYNTGTARSEPVVTDTWIKSHYDAIDVGAFANGPSTYAIASGTYTDSRVVSTYDDTFNLYVGCDGNGAGSLGGEIKPVITRCTMESWEPYDWGVRTYMGGYGSGAATMTNSPVIDRCDLRTRVNGGGVRVATYAESPSGPTTDTVITEPRVLSTPITARNYDGVEVYASSDHAGSIKHNALVLRSPVVSDEGIDLDADSNGDAGVDFTSRVLGLTGPGTVLEASDADAVNMNANTNSGALSFKPQMKDLNISGNSEAVELHAVSDGVGDVTCDPVVQRIKADRKWAMNDDAIHLDAWSSGGGVSMAPVVTDSILDGPGDDGIEFDSNGSTGCTATPVVKNNVIRSCGGYGVLLDNNGTSMAPSSTATVQNNVISRTYEASIYLDGYPLGLVTMNKTAYAGYGNTSDIYNSSGVYWSGAAGGEVKGNLIRANRYGVALESCNPYPKVNYNSFADSRGRTNKWNVWTDCSTVASVNAENNWWKYTASADISRTIDEYNGVEGAVDYLPALGSLAPKLTVLSATKQPTRVRFLLTFDRRMDTSIRRLYFGPTSPYRRFGVTGTWVNGGKTWVGFYSPRSALPTGVWMYFSGAKDLPGTAMNSLSKRFKL